MDEIVEILRQRDNKEDDDNISVDLSKDDDETSEEKVNGGGTNDLLSKLKLKF